MLAPMRFTVEPSPAGGFHVRLAGTAAPLSHHDTEQEAEARRLAYERGAGEPARGELVDLPDGSEVLVRPVRAEDKPLFGAALTTRELEFFTELDHVDHEALGAIDPRSGEGLGVARYMRNPDRPDSAEAAVAVIDAWQGRGLGGLLLRRLTRRATANGITTFTASLLTGNRGMLRLFERLGAVRTRGVEAGVMEIDVELPLDDAKTLLRTAATGHVRSITARD
jgi:GNAT superfamily N-acetyltransferase